MAQFDYDLFVIGGGSGGVRAARVAAQDGARVAIAEEYRYSGTCVIRGCVPKKLFVYASGYSGAFTDSAAFGWNVGDVSFDWSRLVANKDKEINRLNKIYINMLDRAGAEIFHDRAVLTDPHTVQVGDKQVTAKYILIATGGSPRSLGVPGCEVAISSNEAFHFPELPERITVVGGGYIGVEFAHIFAGMGVKTSFVHHRGLVLRGFDHEIRVAVTEGLYRHGIECFMDDEVTEIDKLPEGQSPGLCVSLRSGGSVEVDAVMAAIGRTPNTSNMGLEQVGVKLDDNAAVVVDQFSKTDVDHIYAVGDCTNRVNLTPVAIREGQAFVDTVFRDQPTPVNYDCIPTAVFSQPAASTVGMTEAEAREAFEQVDIYRSAFRPLKHTLSGRNDQTMIKLVVDANSQRVVGVHMVGEDAAEIIQAVAIAVRMGATKADFDATVALHPTTAEELVLMRTKVEVPDG